MREWVLGVARFLSTLGGLAVIGAGGWLLTVAPAAADRLAARQFLRVAAAVFVVGTLAATFDGGRALIVRDAFAVALLVLAALWDRRQRGWWRGVAATAGVFGLATFPFAGHSNSLAPRVLWFVVDFLHLAAIAVWAGGLVVLLLAGRDLLATARGERIARRYSTAVAICIPIIVATGIAQAWKLGGGFDDVAATDWGRVLLIKVALVVVMLAVAAVSRWLLLRDCAGSIPRTVVVEAMIGVAALGLAAGMAGLPPAPAVAAQPFAAQLTDSGLIVEVSVGPGVVGGNDLHVVITPPGGSIVPVVAAAARVSLASVVPAAPVQLVSEGPNHYSGVVTFPRAGDWTLDIIVEVTAGETVLLTITVPVP